MSSLTEGDALFGTIASCTWARIVPVVLMVFVWLIPPWTKPLIIHQFPVWAGAPPCSPNVISETRSPSHSNESHSLWGDFNNSYSLFMSYSKSHPLSVTHKNRPHLSDLTKRVCAAKELKTLSNYFRWTFDYPTRSSQNKYKFIWRKLTADHNL